jgi:molybdopterin-guanine dinucleotide biosynthesis adapter protein
MKVMRVIGLAGWSGAGKTTLIARLIPELNRRGHSVSTIKHAHHRFDVDYPGKDSYVHRTAGAREVLVASGERFALMHELRGTPEPDLKQFLKLLSPVDFVLIEGFKPAPLAKIEVHRHENGKPWLYPDDPTILAVATDTPDQVVGIPAFALEDACAIADCIEASALPLDQLLVQLT